MRFRKRLFNFLALLTLVYMGGGALLVSNAVRATQSDMPADYNSTQQTAYQFGAGLASSGIMTVIACTGLFAFCLFAFMAHRNGVALRREQMHQEQLQAIRESK